MKVLVDHANSKAGRILEHKSFPEGIARVYLQTGSDDDLTGHDVEIHLRGGSDGLEGISVLWDDPKEDINLIKTATTVQIIFKRPQ
jgi:hypothetical protein